MSLLDDVIDVGEDLLKKAVETEFPEVKVVEEVYDRLKKHGDGGHGENTEHHDTSDSHNTKESHDKTDSHNSTDSHNTTDSHNSTDSHNTTDSHNSTDSHNTTDSHNVTGSHNVTDSYLADIPADYQGEYITADDYAQAETAPEQGAWEHQLEDTAAPAGEEEPQNDQYHVDAAEEDAPSAW